MASTTIHTLSYKMVADTRQFSSGLLATKSEVQMLKKIMGDTSPEQRAQAAYDRLDKLLDKGKINVDQYQRAWSKVSEELIEADRAARMAAKSQDQINESIRKGQAIGKAVAGAGAAGGGGGMATVLPFGGNIKTMLGAFAGYKLISGGIADITAELQRLDANQKAADRFNMAIDDFERLQFLLTNPAGADLEAGSAVNVIDTMRKNISLAARDMGKAKEFFGELGFEMDTIASLNMMDATSQFQALSAEISKIQSASDRGLVLQKIFGTDEGRFNSLMAEGATSVQKLIDKTEELGVAQGEAAGNVTKLFDSLDKTEEQYQALINTISKNAVAPTVAAGANFTANAMEGLRRTIQNPGSVGGIGDAVKAAAGMGMQMFGQNFANGEWLAGELNKSFKPREVGLNQQLLKQMEQEQEFQRRNEQLQLETINAIREAMGRPAVDSL